MRTCGSGGADPDIPIQARSGRVIYGTDSRWRCCTALLYEW